MKILTREELGGVIAHELSHSRHRDILVGTVAATIAGANRYLAHLAQYSVSGVTRKATGATPWRPLS
jgi:heat shock protein HtpX